MLPPKIWTHRNLPVKFIAIDGHGGSGKSTLATLLAREFDAEIIHIDDFTGQHKSEDWWKRVVVDVFQPIQEGAERLNYSRASWWKNHQPQPVENQPVKNIMILEGVGAFREEFRPFISYSFFVDTPRNICLARGIKRDDGNDEKTRDEICRIWKNWYEAEEEYLRLNQVRESADRIIEGTVDFETHLIPFYSLRVFTHEAGESGNPLYVFADKNSALDVSQRLAIIQSTKLDEAVFLETESNPTIRIYNPQQEVDFAGHALIGTAALLNQIDNAHLSLATRNGAIEAWQTGNKTWIRAQLVSLPPWNLNQLSTPSEINNLNMTQTARVEHTLFWSWINEMKGLIRARTFAPDWGIPESEANGSGAMLLTKTLGRSLIINHGTDSLIHTIF